MTVSRPPTLASWLLEHLVLGEKNEALAGDLLEEFQHRHSVAWYWRQVLGAILAGFVSELRAEWSSAGYVVVWTFGFAAIWTRLAPGFWEYLVAPATLQFPWLNHGEVFLTWIPGGLFGVDSVFFLSTGILIYSAGIRSFNLRRFLRGLFAGLLMFFVEDVTFRFVGGLYGLSLWRVIGFFWTWLSWLPTFVAVLASMWMAWPNWRQPETSQNYPAVS